MLIYVDLFVECYQQKCKCFTCTVVWKGASYKLEVIMFPMITKKH